MQVDNAAIEAVEGDVAAILRHGGPHAGIQQFLDLGDDLLVLRSHLGLDRLFQDDRSDGSLDLLHLSGHPLDDYAVALKRKNMLTLDELQAKAEAQLEQNPSITIGSGVVEFLAHRISSNVRVLEGALTRLFAFASLVGREINLDMAQECLADILRASERKVTIDEIIRKVADHYNLRISDIMSARRARAVARPRQVAMFLCKMLTTRSLPEIGRKFGGRDHTTVIHAVKKIEELRNTDSQIAEDVELLRRMLEA